AYDVSIDGLSQKESRKLISKALLLDRYNGTTWAIKEALRAVFPTAVVKEWFNYGGKPFFKVKVSTTNVSFDERTLNTLERLIYDLKM
ncbi:phage tail protein, partial [Campylobacter jejuni]|nr:phage tail protein [Campylobacter jejuni]